MQCKIESNTISFIQRLKKKKILNLHQFSISWDRNGQIQLV